MQEGEAATPQYEYEYVYEYEDVEDASKKVLAPAPVFRDQPPGKAQRSGHPAENRALSLSAVLTDKDNSLVLALVPFPQTQKGTFCVTMYTDKKENQIFFIYKEI